VTGGDSVAGAVYALPMKRGRFWILIIVLVGSFVSIATMQRFYHSKFGTAFGRVVDAADGSGIEGAQIELYAEFERGGDGGDVMKLPLKVETGEDGAFRFKSTVGGEFRLAVVHPLYAGFSKEAVKIESSAENNLGVVELSRR